VSIGVNANWEQNLALQAHLGWTRLDIGWKDINPQPGVWDFAVTDSQVNDALAQGQQILAILHLVPAWLTTNADIPPLSTSQWSAFVQQMAQHFAGRIAAYEIWNEPDDGNINGDGIGWGRNIEEPPLYTDFVHAAAVQIRAYAPGTLVVAPAFQSRNTASGVDNRKKRILDQIQGASYPEGPGYSFVDVISVHNNAGDTEPSRDMGRRLNYENLAYVWNHAPSMRTKPVWVTEYGWKSSSVTEAGQSEKICNVTRTYTGLLEAAYTSLGDWDVRRAFIYSLKDGGSRQIFRSDNSPKPTVTQYLQHLAYPAVQNPAYSADYPACSGAGLTAFASSSPETSGDVWSAFARLGLRDPRPGIPSGFSALAAERSPDGQSISAAFQSRDGVLDIFVSPSSADNAGRRLLSDTGAEWTSGPVHVSVSGMRSGSPIGKEIIRALGTALDPAFDKACMTESVLPDDGVIRSLGYRPPQAPPSFAEVDASLELTRPTRGCRAGAFKEASVIDLTWKFQNAANEVIRAGIYRYGTGWKGSLSDERSLHWSDAEGTRYWVATEASTVTPALKEALQMVAESMDPGFSK